MGHLGFMSAHFEKLRAGTTHRLSTRASAANRELDRLSEQHLELALAMGTRLNDRGKMPEAAADRPSNHGAGGTSAEVHGLAKPILTSSNLLLARMFYLCSYWSWAGERAYAFPI